VVIASGFSLNCEDGISPSLEKELPMILKSRQGYAKPNPYHMVAESVAAFTLVLVAVMLVISLAEPATVIDYFCK
jgi:hypothetical protein